MPDTTQPAESIDGLIGPRTRIALSIAQLDDKAHANLTIDLVLGNEALLLTTADLVDLVDRLSGAETDPCRFDRNGDCQEHGFFDLAASGGLCPIQKAHQVVAQYRPAPAAEPAPEV